MGFIIFLCLQNLLDEISMAAYLYRELIALSWFRGNVAMQTLLPKNTKKFIAQK